MCCFSQPVQSVTNTRIFARRFNQDRQYLAYSLQFATTRPNAMILPLPLAAPTRPNAVRFINLKEYKRFFEDIVDQFRIPQIPSLGRAKAAVAFNPLPVQTVGDFVATFVPTIRDFSRLDPRFAIQPSVWRRLPHYADYGFVVFQLKAPLRKLTEVHPMALEFRTRLKEELFFPTVHIHDGKVHDKEEFDHQLYWQGRDESVWSPEMLTIKDNPRFGEWDQQMVAPPGFPRPVRIVEAHGRRSFVVADEPDIVTIREENTLINGIASRPQPVPPPPPPHESFGMRMELNRTVDVRRAKGIYSPKMEIHRWTIREVRANEDILI